MRPNRAWSGSRQLSQRPRAGLDREVGIVRDVRDAVEGRDLGVEEIAHEEAVAEPDPAELLERLHASGFLHQASPSAAMAPETTRK